MLIALAIIVIFFLAGILLCIYTKNPAWLLLMFLSTLSGFPASYIADRPTSPYYVTSIDSNTVAFTDYTTDNNTDTINIPSYYYLNIWAFPFQRYECRDCPLVIQHPNEIETHVVIPPKSKATIIEGKLGECK